MEKDINLWASPMSSTPWSSSSVHHLIYYPPQIQGAAFTDNISPREEIWLSGVSKKTIQVWITPKSMFCAITFFPKLWHSVLCIPLQGSPFLFVVLCLCMPQINFIGVSYKKKSPVYFNSLSKFQAQVKLKKFWSILKYQLSMWHCTRSSGKQEAH